MVMAWSTNILHIANRDSELRIVQGIGGPPMTVDVTGLFPLALNKPITNARWLREVHSIRISDLVAVMRFAG